MPDVTKPYKFIGFGAVDVTTPCKFIGLGAVDVATPSKFIGFGAMDVTKPYRFIGFGALSAGREVVATAAVSMFAGTGGEGTSGAFAGGVWGAAAPQNTAAAHI